MNKEIEFYYGVNHLITKYGYNTFIQWYWNPHKIRNGLPIIHKPCSPFEQDVMLIHQRLNNPRNFNTLIHKKFLSKLNHFLQKMNIDLHTHKFALYRYYLVGALNNISLSVAPEIKKNWNISFELFGSFYNTNSPYCSLFSDIEPRAICDVLHFKVKPNSTILINPPYTEDWIRIACKLTHEYLLLPNTIYLVIPIWNVSDRLLCNLPILYDDLPCIDEMKLSPYLISHRFEHLKFYDGIHKKHKYLCDKVHIFHLQSI